MELLVSLLGAADGLVFITSLLVAIFVTRMYLSCYVSIEQDKNAIGGRIWRIESQSDARITSGEDKRKLAASK